MSEGLKSIIFGCGFVRSGRVELMMWLLQAGESCYGRLRFEKKKIKWGY